MPPPRPPPTLSDDAPFPQPGPGRSWADVRNDYDTDGVVCIRGLFSAAGGEGGGGGWIEYLAAECDVRLKVQAQDPGPTVFNPDL